MKSEDTDSEDRKDSVAQIIGIRWTSPSETLPNGHPVHHLHRHRHPVHHQNSTNAATSTNTMTTTNTNGHPPPSHNAQIEGLIVADGLHSIHCRLLHPAPYRGLFALNKMVNLKQFVVQRDVIRNGIYLVVTECAIYSVLPELPSVYGTYCKDINAEYEVQQLLKAKVQSSGMATVKQNHVFPAGNDRKRRFGASSDREVKRVRTELTEDHGLSSSAHSMSSSSSSETTVSEVPRANVQSVQSVRPNHVVDRQCQAQSQAVAAAQIESFDHILKDFVVQNNHRFQSMQSMQSMAGPMGSAAISSAAMSSAAMTPMSSGPGCNSPKSPITPISVTPSRMDVVPENRGTASGGSMSGGSMSGFQFNGQKTLSKMSDALDCSRTATMRMFKEFDACYSSFTMSSGWQPQ